jgi:hypothetical protein
VYYQLAHNVRHPKRVTLAELISGSGRVGSAPVPVDWPGLRLRGRGWRGRRGVRDTQGSGEHGLGGGGGLVGSRRLGLIWVVEALWERLAIGPTVRRVVGDGAELKRALLAMTANRLGDPQSKRGVWERWREKVYLPGSERLSKAASKNNLYVFEC